MAQTSETYNIKHGRDDFLVIRGYASNLGEILFIIMEENLFASKYISFLAPKGSHPISSCPERTCHVISVN